MPETTTTTDSSTESLGWRAGLTGDLQQNDTFKNFKGVSDLATDYLDKTSKYTELEGKLKDYVPKLPDNATDAEKGLYFEALGRPKQASEYEFEGEDKNAPEWTSHWKQVSHNLGLTKSQAKQLSTEFNGQMTKMVEAHNAKMQGEVAKVSEKLKSEWGDKFDTNVELAKRMTQKHLGTEFDAAFDGGNELTRLNTMRMLFKFAQMTGEDKSPSSTNRPTSANGVDNPYPKSNMPPKRQVSFAAAG
jgi:hypothetical protein